MGLFCFTPTLFAYCLSSQSPRIFESHFSIEARMFRVFLIAYLALTNCLATAPCCCLARGIVEAFVDSVSNERDAPHRSCCAVGKQNSREVMPFIETSESKSSQPFCDRQPTQSDSPESCNCGSIESAVATSETSRYDRDFSNRPLSELASIGHFEKPLYFDASLSQQLDFCRLIRGIYCSGSLVRISLQSWLC